MGQSSPALFDRVQKIVAGARSPLSFPRTSSARVLQKDEHKRGANDCREVQGVYLFLLILVILLRTISGWGLISRTSWRKRRIRRFVTHSILFMSNFTFIFYRQHCQLCCCCSLSLCYAISLLIYRDIKGCQQLRSFRMEFVGFGPFCCLLVLPPRRSRFHFGIVIRGSTVFIVSVDIC